MRHVPLTFPWFLALVLSCLSACEDAFRIPICEFDSSREGCAQIGGGMGQPGGGSMPGGSGGMSGMTSPSKKAPITFSFMTKSTELSNSLIWAGVHQGRNLLFANQILQNNINIHSFKLELSNGKWDFNSSRCMDCPMQISGANLSGNKVLTGNSVMFIVNSNNAYSINSMQSTVNVNPINNTDLIFPFRPFVSPIFDVIIYQKKKDTQNISEINIFSSHNMSQSIEFANRSTTPSTTYYTIGDWDGRGTNFSDSEVLIFESQSLKAFRFAPYPTLQPDDELTKSLNKAVVTVSDGSTRPIRSAFIADLNNDGYSELIFARGPQIFFISYNPKNGFDSWSDTNFTIKHQPNGKEVDIERTETLSAADLDGDGYSDLAIETYNPNVVYFYLNNKN